MHCRPACIVLAIADGNCWTTGFEVLYAYMLLETESKLKADDTAKSMHICAGNVTPAIRLAMCMCIWQPVVIIITVTTTLCSIHFCLASGSVANWCANS